ncbi:MAG: alpha/beta hydrolase, partial [Pseudomonadales bacterium]|nr:alpha/beta hydrolase [Pseudomonadales bacterium]
YQSEDGLRLYARDYNSASSRLTLLCMPGLTRNCADFSELCTELAPLFRIIVADQRGRGRSDYDDNSANYHPATYVRDMFTLLDKLTINNVVLIGTSLGGLMAMLMGSMQARRFAGIVLNDIGPQIDPAGLERIKSNVATRCSVSDWPQAVANSKAINGLAFPDYSDSDWLRFSKKLYREVHNSASGQSGLILAYDPAIADAFKVDDTEAAPMNLWPSFDALADIPLLLIRGESSDILSKACVQKMQQKRPDLTAIEIPRRGHAPMLDEACAINAIQAFLAGLSAQLAV